MYFKYLIKEVGIITISVIFSIFFCDCNILVNQAKAEIIYQKEKEINEIEKLNGKLEDSKVSYFEPNVSFLDFEGKEVSLKDFRQNVVLVYFWASYCWECTDALKSLAKIKEELEFKQIKNIKVLPISVDYKKPEKVNELLMTREIKLDLFFDKNRSLLSAFGVNKIPSFFIINQEGMVINEIVEEVVDFSNPVMMKYLQQLAGKTNEKKVEKVEKENIIDPENEDNNDNIEHKDKENI